MLHLSFIILQAFHKHKLVDPLENPGLSDLTADVDFSQLRIAASMTPGEENYAIVLGPVKQMEFLERLQANVRLQVRILYICIYACIKAYSNSFTY